VTPSVAARVTPTPVTSLDIVVRVISYTARCLGVATYSPITSFLCCLTSNVRILKAIRE